jgi:hypothetical protein
VQTATLQAVLDATPDVTPEALLVDLDVAAAVVGLAVVELHRVAAVGRALAAAVG